MALTSEQLFQSQSNPKLGVNIVLLTEHNTNDLVDGVPKALWIKSGGSFVGITTGGSEVNITSFPSDTYVDWIQLKVLKTANSCVVYGIY